MFKKEHEFKTAKQDKKGAAKRFIGAFLAFALVFGTISAVVIVKHNDISLESLFGEKSTTASDEAASTESTSDSDFDMELTGKANVLLYCADNEMTEIYFMILVCADMDTQSFSVQPMKTDNSAYLSAVSTDGGKGLVAAVEKAEGVEIDKYISSNPDTFALAINYMGGLKYSVAQRIEYRTEDYTLILTKGNQTIKGETLLKYFRYCKTLGESGLTQQGELVCTMIDEYITAENVQNGMTIYQKVLSKINSASDISYIEASKAMQMLRLLCNSDERVPAEVVYDTQSNQK